MGYKHSENSAARPVGWAAAIGEHVTSMQAAGRSPGTIRIRRHYLRMLAETQRDPWAATTASLERFLSREKWAPETRKSARAAVRSFYAWAHGRGYIADDPALALPGVKVPPGRPRPAPEHLVAQLVRADDRIGYMAMLAAYAGLRCAEIARCRPQTDLVGDELTITGKGGRVRAVPILNRPLLARLERDRLRGGWAFPNGRGGHLSAGHVSKLLSAALPGGWTGHTLRHRFGTQAYRGTRDLLAVRDLLGHAMVNTTQRYVLTPDDALRAAVAAAAS